MRTALSIPYNSCLGERCPPLLSARANSGFPTTQISRTTTYASFFEESRMRFTQATKPDRKSGGSRGTCNAPFLNATAKGEGLKAAVLLDGEAHRRSLRSG